MARETLRAYFEADRNVSSTAAALGVDRRTVRNRIGAIEELLGRPLRGSLADLEIALRARRVVRSRPSARTFPTLAHRRQAKAQIGVAPEPPAG